MYSRVRTSFIVEDSSIKNTHRNFVSNFEMSAPKNLERDAYLKF